MPHRIEWFDLRVIGLQGLIFFERIKRSSRVTSLACTISWVNFEKFSFLYSIRPRSRRYKNGRVIEERESPRLSVEIGIDRLQARLPFFFCGETCRCLVEYPITIGPRFNRDINSGELGEDRDTPLSPCWHNGHRRGRLSRSVISRGIPPQISPSFNRRFHAFAAS